MSYKKDFPLFKTHPDLAYLDSGATSQKPQTVIDAVADFYASANANVHRGIYRLSEEATGAYEGVREKVRAFINAKSSKEIIFTSGTTESINVVATSLANSEEWGKKDAVRVLVTSAEHHANIIPWQLARCQLLVTDYSSDYRFDLEQYKKLLETENIDLVAITHVSNVLGTVNPVKEIVKLAHDAGAKVLVDGAQAVPHIHIDVQDLDADFYVFSGHKMCAPTGVGVLYAKEALLEEMEPVSGGGDMIRRVRFESSEWNELPWKFEAGTPNVAGVIGLGAAIDYLTDIGFESIAKHEHKLGEHTLEKLSSVEGLVLYGPSSIDDRASVFSFSLGGIHPHDLASVLDEHNIAIRAGHHCCMPLHESVLGQPATARASLYLYNEKKDIDRLVEGLEQAKKVLN